jgi:hypothetical protein
MTSLRQSQTGDVSKTNDAPKTGHKMINRKNSLREKVGAAEVGGGYISETAIERAERKLEQHKSLYLAQAEKDRTQLKEYYQALILNRHAPDASVKALSAIGREIKGQAETFGYILLGRFGDSLHQLTRQMTRVNDRQIDLIKAHIDAIDVVVSQNITGTGGHLGEELSNTLRRAIQQVAVS